MSDASAPIKVWERAGQPAFLKKSSLDLESPKIGLKDRFGDRFRGDTEPQTLKTGGHEEVPGVSYRTRRTRFSAPARPLHAALSIT